MKYITILIFLLIMSSCNKKGDITTEPKDFIIIHNKVYKLIGIVPCNGCNTMWVLYPKDSLDIMPEIVSISDTVSVTVDDTVIKIN